MHVFTCLVMQMNGEVTDRRRYTWVELQSEELLRRNAEGFRLLLEAHLPLQIKDIVRFRISLDGRYEIDWQQADDFSAAGTVFLAERPVMTCWLLSGYDALRDTAAVEAVEEVLEGWRGDGKMNAPAGAGIGGVADRPLLICVPWPPTAEELERKRLHVWALGLAEAFFRRAAAHSDDPARN